jgi:hypothetical protein
MLSVVILSVIMLSVVMLTIVMLSAVMLSVVMLNVVMLSVAAPQGPDVHSTSSFCNVWHLCLEIKARSFIYFSRNWSFLLKALR